MADVGLFFAPDGSSQIAMIFIGIGFGGGHIHGFQIFGLEGSHGAAGAQILAEYAVKALHLALDAGHAARFAGEIIDLQGAPIAVNKPAGQILEAEGAHNINLVTPEHFVPLLVPALDRAKRQGLTIPVVYNTGSYEKVEAVKALEGLVDVWLPDLKYVSSILSARHTGAADYFSCASAAIAEMVRQCPEPVFSDGSHTIDCPDDADDPLMIRGVLVRHLALPGCGQDSRAVLRYLHETYGDRIFISIMNQYTPMLQVFDEKRGEKTISDPNLCRRLTEEEYDALVDYAIDLGIQNGFIQESGTVSPSYIPVFDGTGILSQ